jgi:hypothetical protein
MAEIYENSYITLAASRLSGSTGSLFVEPPASNLSSVLTFTRTSAESKQYDIHFRKGAENGETSQNNDKRGLLLPIRGWASARDLDREEYEIYVRQPLDHGDPFNREEDGGLPLLRRGWCFQERLLSPRVVHFAHNELYWECRKLITCECSELQAESRSKFHRTKLELAANSPSIQWHRIVEEYTTKDLTFEKDIFPALQGLAKQKGSERDTPYYAGLWKNTLLRDLLWYSGSPSKRPAAWRAPTWSWASVATQVRWKDSKDEYYRYLKSSAIVEKVRTQPVGEDAFGELQSAELTLRGLCVAASLAKNKHKNKNTATYSLSILGQDWHTGRSWFSIHLFPDYEYGTKGQYFIEDDTLVRIMRIASVSKGNSTATSLACLVFRCIDERRQIYERIGLTRINISNKHRSERDVFEQVGREMSLNIV